MKTNYNIKFIDKFIMRRENYLLFIKNIINIQKYVLIYILKFFNYFFNSLNSEVTI